MIISGRQPVDKTKFEGRKHFCPKQQPARSTKAILVRNAMKAAAYNMGFGGSRGDTTQAMGIWLAIGRQFRRDDPWPTFAAKQESNYLYPGGRKVGSGFSNTRPTAKPFPLGAIASKHHEEARHKETPSRLFYSRQTQNNNRPCFCLFIISSRRLRRRKN